MSGQSICNLRVPEFVRKWCEIYNNFPIFAKILCLVTTSDGWKAEQIRNAQLRELR